MGQVVLSKPKVLQEPREESRHPGFSQLTQFLSGLSNESGGDAGGGAAGGVGGGMNAFIQQLAPQLANVVAGQVPAMAQLSDVTLQNIDPIGAVASTASSSIVSSSSSSSKGANQIEELANLFIGVLSGVLSEKLVRSVNSTYEVTLENVDGIGEDQFLFYLDLKRGLGELTEILLLC